jgi:hypothetical protein
MINKINNEYYEGKSNFFTDLNEFSAMVNLMDLLLSIKNMDYNYFLVPRLSFQKKSTKSPVLFHQVNQQSTSVTLT